MTNKLLALLFKSYRLYSSSNDLLQSLNNIHTVYYHSFYNQQFSIISNFISYEPENLIWIKQHNNSHQVSNIYHFLLDNEPLACLSYYHIDLQYQFRRGNNDIIIFIDDLLENQHINYNDNIMIYSYNLKNLTDNISSTFIEFKEQLLRIESFLMMEKFNNNL